MMPVQPVRMNSFIFPYWLFVENARVLFCASSPEVPCLNALTWHWSQVECSGCVPGDRGGESVRFWGGLLRKSRLTLIFLFYERRRKPLKLLLQEQTDTGSSGGTGSRSAWVTEALLTDLDVSKRRDGLCCELLLKWLKCRVWTQDKWSKEENDVYRSQAAFIWFYSLLLGSFSIKSLRLSDNLIWSRPPHLGVSASSLSKLISALEICCKNENLTSQSAVIHCFVINLKTFLTDIYFHKFINI